MNAAPDDAAVRVATLVAEQLATPEQARTLATAGQGWWPQSLAYGAAGIALLHIERARTGHGPWQRAHAWLACAAADGADVSDRAHLHYGAPAIAFAAHTAASAAGGYGHALGRLDTAIITLVRTRVHAAHARLDGDTFPTLAEFDAIRGLAGLGAYLLARHLGSAVLREVLSYLVRLADDRTDRTDHGEHWPGWWSHVAPSGTPSPDYPGGHANLGMAHGVAGVLALLSLALRRGITVDGHIAAIGRICAWLDQWRHHGPRGAWWPALITRAHRSGEKSPAGPHRPSWCYGTPGVARAQQLAALATGDSARQRAAELALARSAEADMRAMLTDASLCHGRAGLAHLVHRATAEAVTPELRQRLPYLLPAALNDTAPREVAERLLEHGDIGLLKGAAGTALALHTTGTGILPTCGWDACLLIN